jgi:hypothetical protein
MWWFIGILVYVAVLLLSMSALMAEFKLQTSSDWVKVIFWPITVVVYFLGLLLWVLIWVPRKLFQGILLCFDEIKEFFVYVFCSAIEDEDQKNIKNIAN